MLGLAAALAAGACGQNTPGGYLPEATLRQDAASELAPPGATSLATLSAEPFNNITGPQAGFYGHLFGTDLGSDDVSAFYARELVARGWRATRAPIRGSTESQAWGWCKPNMLFRLAILERDGYDARGLPGADRSALVFDATIVGTKQPCPST